MLLIGANLKVVERLGEAVLEPVVLEAPLAVLGHRRRRAQLPQVPRSVLRQLASVVLNLVPKRRNNNLVTVHAGPIGKYAYAG